MKRKITSDAISFYTQSREGKEVLLYKLNLDKNDIDIPKYLDGITVDCVEKSDESIVALSSKNSLIIFEPIDRNSETLILMPAIFYNENVSSLYIQKEQLCLETDLNQLMKQNDIPDYLLKLELAKMTSIIYLEPNSLQAHKYKKINQITDIDDFTEAVTDYDSNLHTDSEYYLHKTDGRVSFSTHNKGKWNEYYEMAYLDKNYKNQLYYTTMLGKISHFINPRLISFLIPTAILGGILTLNKCTGDTSIPKSEPVLIQKANNPYIKNEILHNR